ncbi:MAG: phage tail assembly chaperone [Pseudomonadota bacterium]
MTELGLSPRDFWSLSLSEWRWLAAAAGLASDFAMDLAMDRAALAHLVQQFPDGAS